MLSHVHAKAVKNERAREKTKTRRCSTNTWRLITFTLSITIVVGENDDCSWTRLDWNSDRSNSFSIRDNRKTHDSRAVEGDADGSSADDDCSRWNSVDSTDRNSTMNSTATTRT